MASKRSLTGALYMSWSHKPNLKVNAKEVMAWSSRDSKKTIFSLQKTYSRANSVLRWSCGDVGSLGNIRAPQNRCGADSSESSQKSRHLASLKANERNDQEQEMIQEAVVSIPQALTGNVCALVGIVVFGAQKCFSIKINLHRHLLFIIDFYFD